MAQWIRADGTFQDVKPVNGKDFSLKELQFMVGGFVEIKKLPNGQWLVLNEEGKIEGLPMNKAATSLYGHMPNDFIVGDVVLCREGEVT